MRLGRFGAYAGGMRRLRRALLVLFCFVPLLAFGQTGTTVSGKITQTENGMPLSGALVVIDELRLEVRAGDDGGYRFENVPVGEYHIGVRAEGYSTRRTELTVGTNPVTLDISVDFDLHFAEVLSVSPAAPCTSPDASFARNSLVISGAPGSDLNRPQPLTVTSTTVIVARRRTRASMPVQKRTVAYCPTCSNPIRR